MGPPCRAPSKGSVGIDAGVGIGEPTGQDAGRAAGREIQPWRSPAPNVRPPSPAADSSEPARIRRSIQRENACVRQIAGKTGVGVAVEALPVAARPNRSMKPCASSTASWMAQIHPLPPAGVITWAASPATNTGRLHRRRHLHPQVDERRLDELDAVEPAGTSRRMVSSRPRCLGPIGDRVGRPAPRGRTGSTPGGVASVRRTLGDGRRRSCAARAAGACRAPQAIAPATTARRPCTRAGHGRSRRGRRRTRRRPGIGPRACSPDPVNESVTPASSLVDAADLRAEADVAIHSDEASRKPGDQLVLWVDVVRPPAGRSCRSRTPRSRRAFGTRSSSWSGRSHDADRRCQRTSTFDGSIVHCTGLGHAAHVGLRVALEHDEINAGGCSTWAITRPAGPAPTIATAHRLADRGHDTHSAAQRLPALGLDRQQVGWIGGYGT